MMDADHLPFRKTLRLGTLDLGNGARRSSVYVQISYLPTVGDPTLRRLSFSGVEGPRANGDADGTRGQINLEAQRIIDGIEPADGWDVPRIRRVFMVWDRWHMNDCRAGSPRQMDWLREHPITVYPDSHYEEASRRLAAVGLNPDPRFLRDGNPYLYGRAWLYETVPGGILNEIRSWPDGTGLPTCWERDGA
jgi:hypothetical protein